MKKSNSTIIPGYRHFLHGGDYNPDQWQEYPEIISQDFKLMKLSGCNTFSVGIFAWTAYEKSEGVYDFGWLDDIMDRMAKEGNKVFLATPSGARPAWMAKKYPEVCRVTADGLRQHYSHRHNHCWSAPVYRAKVQQINELLAQRYAKHPALGGWHISNEYNGACYCPLCLANFREYLKRKYRTLDEFNRASWSPFWSHTYTSWDEICVDDNCLDNLKLEWFHFNSWQLCDFFKMEIDAVRKYSDAPVTTNMMGLCDSIDYYRVGELCDFIADDRYPGWADIHDFPGTAAQTAMIHDMHRAMQHKPFVMMESTPSTVNWDSCSRLKRPGLHQTEALLAVGHGADGVMYFQWRKGRGGGEKFHGAVVDHEGSANSRVFKEVSQVGEALKKLEPVLGTTTKAQVAVVFDWTSNMALKFTAGPSDAKLKQFITTIGNHYRALWEQNIPMDVIESTADFTPYKVIVAPMLYALRPGVAKRIEAFVKKGGVWISTYLSSYTDEHNRVHLGGLPGEGLRKVFGIWQEEIDGLAPDDEQSMVAVKGNALKIKGSAKVHTFAEILHLEGAKALATYGCDFYAGTPAVTVNAYGKGAAYYIAARTEMDFLREFYTRLADCHKLQRTMAAAPGLHATVRNGEDGKEYLFVYNFNANAAECALKGNGVSMLDGTKMPAKLTLPAFGSQVYKLD